MRYLHLNLMDEWGVGVQVRSMLNRRIDQPHRRGDSLDHYNLGPMLIKFLRNGLTRDDISSLDEIKWRSSHADKIYISVHGTQQNTTTCTVQEGNLDPVMTEIPRTVFTEFVKRCVRPRALRQSPLRLTLVMCWGGRNPSYWEPHEGRNSSFYKASFAYAFFRDLVATGYTNLVLKAGMGTMRVEDNHVETQNDAGNLAEVEYQNWLEVNGDRLQQMGQALEDDIAEAKRIDSRYEGIYYNVRINSTMLSPQDAVKEELLNRLQTLLVNDRYTELLAYSERYRQYLVLVRQHDELERKKNLFDRGGRIRYTTHDGGNTVKIEIIALDRSVRTIDTEL